MWSSSCWFVWHLQGVNCEEGFPCHCWSWKSSFGTNMALSPFCIVCFLNHEFAIWKLRSQTSIILFILLIDRNRETLFSALYSVLTASENRENIFLMFLSYAAPLTSLGFFNLSICLLMSTGLMRQVNKIFQPRKSYPYTCWLFYRLQAPTYILHIQLHLG